VRLGSGDLRTTAIHLSAPPPAGKPSASLLNRCVMGDYAQARTHVPHVRDTGRIAVLQREDTEAGGFGNTEEQAEA
jgi:hypothetical protein